QATTCKEKRQKCRFENPSAVVWEKRSQRVSSLDHPSAQRSFVEQRFQGHYHSQALPAGQVERLIQHRPFYTH
ncbi:MAG: hypothetical protein N2Z63_06705, partial [Thiobacillaceae bacterium]|nr:hypothetical protein [Thiobacillaceae bacterium]